MTSFFKVSGAGNDFIALVEPDRTPRAEEIRVWCRRGLSVGADGVVVLTRAVRGARMRHFNADGGRSDLCLNGSRCAAQLAFHLGWRKQGSLELLTDAGALQARRVDEHRVGLELPAMVGTPDPTMLEVDGRGYKGYRLTVGVPHFVVPWTEELGHAPVEVLGPALRAHPDLSPEGANVSFVRFVSSGRLEIRTYERGVECETLACGTGVVAAAISGVLEGSLDLPVTALTSGGFELTVEGDVNERVALIGDARIVAEGKMMGGALALPAPRRWS